jgi:valyl-tRNA synthetase
LRAALEKGRVYITNLANLERLDITGEMAEPKGAATAVAGPVHVYVFLAGVIDVEGEKGRLGKEIAKVEKDLAVVLKKLANPEFLAKAAEAVVKKEQEKARGLGEKKIALSAALKRIASLEAGG